MSEPSLHPLLARRWSPTAFDASAETRPAEVEALLEAARWAPSAGNSQPWAFLVARRGDAVHARLLPHLAPSAAQWAPSAGLLVVNLCHRFVEGTDWEFSEFAMYDLGQAVAHMTVQAAALGLYVRQFRAFDQAGIAAEFAVPDHWQVTSMSAVGRLPSSLEPPGPMPPGPMPADAMPADAVPADPARQRRPLAAITWPEAGGAGDR